MYLVNAAKDKADNPAPWRQMYTWPSLLPPKYTGIFSSMNSRESKY